MTVEADRLADLVRELTDRLAEQTGLTAVWMERARVLSDLLALGGHEVACAGDGPTGLETLLEVSPDVAFVDLGIPGFDGLELARRARASGSTARLVALTGYGQPEDKQRARDAGFDEHLTKPVLEADVRGALIRSERTL